MARMARMQEFILEFLPFLAFLPILIMSSKNGKNGKNAFLHSCHSCRHSCILAGWTWLAGAQVDLGGGLGEPMWCQWCLWQGLGAYGPREDLFGDLGFVRRIQETLMGAGGC